MTGEYLVYGATTLSALDNEYNCETANAVWPLRNGATCGGHDNQAEIVDH